MVKVRSIIVELIGELSFMIWMILQDKREHRKNEKNSSSKRRGN